MWKVLLPSTCQLCITLFLFPKELFVLGMEKTSYTAISEDLSTFFSPTTYGYYQTLSFFKQERMKSMKFSCEKALLQSAIQTTSRAVSPKSSIPALEGLLLEATNMLSITGYNLEIGICTIVQADIEESGTIVLPSRLFGEIVRKLPDDIIHVTVNTLAVTIECGLSKFNLLGISPEDFPQLPEMDGTQQFKMTQQSMKSMISQTHFAISDNENRPIHTGSLFEVSKTELTIVSVDGFRLAVRREAVSESQNDCSFVVPGSALSEVEKICSDTDELLVITNGMKHIQFQIGASTLISRRLEGEFLAWEKAIPQDNTNKVIINTKQMLHSIERVSLIINEKLKSPLRCVFGENELQFTTKTAIGDAFDSCPIQGDGQNLEIGFNNRYMLDALKAISSEEIRLELTTPVSPCVILPADENDRRFVYMVLPVRLKAE